MTESSSFLQAGGWRPHAVPCLMGFLFKAAYLVQPARRVSLDGVGRPITCATVHWLEAGHSSCQGLHRGVNVRGQEMLGSH